MSDLITFQYEGTTHVFAFPSAQGHVASGMQQRQQFYEQAYLEALRDLVPNGGTWIDVGAYVGTHSVYFATYCAGKVQSFEPHPENFAHLDRNTKNLNVTCHPMALQEASVPPHATFLDGYAFQDVRCIKIDTEGDEPAILRGAKQTIERWRPWIGSEAITQEALGEQTAILTDWGYTRLDTVYNATPTYIWRPQ